MNLNQAKDSISKIESILRLIEGNGQRISPIDRDILLQEVRRLYENILDMETSQSSNATPQPDTNPRSKPQTAKEPEFEIFTSPRTPVSEPPKETPPPPVKEEPVQKAPEIEQRRPTPAPAQSNNNLNQLFEFKQATELSEKLSESPIQDLTKAMSINDRLLYMNELFGGDMDALNESLKLLNKFEQLDQAKGLIGNLAEQYNWLDEEKLEIAQSFIKLIRRRYY